MTKRTGSTAERLRQKPYPQRVFRVESYPACIRPEEAYTGLSVAEFVDLIHAGGVEVQIVAGDWNYGTPRFPSRLLPPHPNVARDRLPEFLELAHQRGILVLSYYPIIYNKQLKELHPEWLMKFLDDGLPAPENKGYFCLNSPFRDWLPHHLNDFLDSLDLDGLYFDDTNWGSHDGRPFRPACCCAYCAARFRDETGLEIPRRVDFTSDTFKRFVNWRYATLRDAFHHITRQVREQHADAVLDFHYYGRPTTDWADGHPLNPLRLEEVGAYFFIETHRTMRESSFVSKVARAHGSSCALWRHAVQTLPECVSSSAPYAEPVTPMLHGLLAMANGGRPQYGMFDGPVFFLGDLMKSITAELKPRVPYIEGETVKYVALHYSQQTRDFYPPEISDSYQVHLEKDFQEMGQKYVIGAYEMLNQSHLLVDIAFDEHLTAEHLSRYKVLFLSNSACLSATQCAAIRLFVRQGGTLIATYETSLYDELGRKQDDFGLGDVLGVRYQGARAGGAVHGVVYVTQDAALSRAFGPVTCFAGRACDISLRSGAAVEVLCSRSSLARERPLDAFDFRRAYDAQAPAVTLHRFGQGQAIYLNGDAGGGYLHNPYPVLKRFVAHLVGHSRPPIEVEAPKAIEVTAARRGPRELMIHLVNNPTPMIPPATPKQDINSYFYLEEVVPVRDIVIQFNDFTVQGVTLPLQGRTLTVSGEPATVVVPEVKLHEVLIVTLE